jgi:hypothetical protein
MLLPGSIGTSYTMCAGDTPTAITSNNSATGGLGTITYTWQSSTSSPSSGFSNISGANSTAYIPSSVPVTTYFRRAASTPSNSAVYSNVVTVSVTAIPILAIIGGTAVCQPDSVMLTVSGASSYTWMPYNILSNSVVLTPSVSQTYTIFANTANGCTASIASSVIVYPFAPPLYVSSYPNPACGADIVTMNASGAVTYTWVPGNLTGSTFTTTLSNSTTFTVFGTDTNGCISAGLTSVMYSSLTSVYILAAPSDSICIGSAVTLTATAFLTYTWQPGTYTGSIISLSPTVATTYTVIGKNTVCTDTLLYTISIIPLPTISIVQSPSIICLGNSGTLTASGADDYFWSGSNFPTMVITPTTNTTYTVKGRIDNFGCENTASITINFSKCVGITENSTNVFISIFPNPSSGYFMLRTEVDAIVEISDELGRLISEYNLDATDDHTIKVLGLKRGIYFIKVSSRASKFTRKIIVD